MHRSTITLAAVATIVMICGAGCSTSKLPAEAGAPDGGQQPGGETVSAHSVPDRLPEENAAPPERIRATPDDIEVDSVPAGAAVVCLPPEGQQSGGAKEAELGVTPLTTPRAACGSGRLLVRIEVKDLPARIEEQPALREWAARFRSEQYFDSTPGSDRFFNFETAVSESAQSVGGGLVSIGPVYNLNEWTSGRICVLFIPRGVTREAFYPLMPPPGTFPRLRGDWPDLLQSRYRLSAEQAETALECLTRCGKYEATVADPFRKDSGRMLSFTATRDGLVSISSGEIRLMPGWNDNP